MRGVRFAVAFALTSLGWAATGDETYIQRQGPDFLAYEELLAAGEDEPPEAVTAKIRALTTTPFINNEAYYRGARPHKPRVDELGPSLRVVMWNIERGIELPAIIEAFRDHRAFIERTRQNPERVDATAINDQLGALASADVLVLNEVDWGLRRSEYRAVVVELAEALDMNWAFGAEFLEIDPKQLGTETFEDVEDEVERREMVERIAVDAVRLKAVHGTAVLSRYPIVEAKLRPFETIGYDWFAGEKESVSKVEEGKRKAAEVIFLETIGREIRRGGRTCLYVTLDVPDIVEKRVVVAAPHLENRTEPANRVKQLREVLTELAATRAPVILAGDFNTTFTDTSPTSLKHETYKILGSSEFWANKAIKYSTGVGLAYDVVKVGVNMTKNYNDPTAKHVPVVAPNPEAGLFSLLEAFRFEEGTVFDFRGDKNRSVNGLEGTLGNSNQRAAKGFAATYSVQRRLPLAGKLKLDWILVKSYLESPRNSKGPYRFAPHFARTMEEINFATEPPLSDHYPISADLPFEEPGDVRGPAAERKKFLGIF